MTNNQDVKKKIINIIKKIIISEISDKELLSVDYLDINRGLIDSLQIVEMIDKIERVFNIRFSSKDLQSEEFRNVNGLVKIVEKSINTK